jgi:hypothetical protein
MAEAKHINKSLSALGNVINALTAPGQQPQEGGGDGASNVDLLNNNRSRSHVHIPYVFCYTIVLLLFLFLMSLSLSYPSIAALALSDTK